MSFSQHLSPRARTIFLLTMGIGFLIIGIDKTSDASSAIRVLAWFGIGFVLLVMTALVWALFLPTDRALVPTTRQQAITGSGDPPQRLDLDFWGNLRLLDVDFSFRDVPETEIFPYSAPASYNSHDSIIRFGAFLSWPSSFRVLTTLSTRLEQLTKPQRLALNLAYLDHQGSGHACTQHSFIVRPIKIAPAMEDFAIAVCSRFYYSQWGAFDLGYDRLLAEFEAKVIAAGLTPLHHSLNKGESPAESLYPVAATEQNIARFAANHQAVMGQLAPLLADPILREELVILLLADNSD